MAEPFSSERAYFAAMQALVRARVQIAQTMQGEAAERAWLQAELQEKQLRARSRATVQAGIPVPIDFLCYAFGLNEFERHCLYLSVAIELDSGLAVDINSLFPQLSRYPDLEACLRTYTASEMTRLALLRSWYGRSEVLENLFCTNDRGDFYSGLSHGLRLHARILDFIFEPTKRCERLDGIISLHYPGEYVAQVDFRQQQAEQIERLQAAFPEEHLLYLLQGETGSGRRTLVHRFCAAHQLPLLVADLQEMQQSKADWTQLLRWILCESVIMQAVLCLTHGELLLEKDNLPPTEDAPAPVQGERHSALPALLRQVERSHNRLFVLTTEEFPPEPDRVWRMLRFTLDCPTAEQRTALWQHYLTRPIAQGLLQRTAEKFTLQPAQIRAACLALDEQLVRQGQEAPDEQLVLSACRAQLATGVDAKVRVAKTCYSWDDLILQPEQKRRLQDACAQVEMRHRIYERYGFGKKIAYGRGVSMLFSGPPGTGKTMAAQVVAGRLGLALHQVDLSAVLSKYIGESEKMLAQLFENGRRSQSILFFDEADALFGKRTETKDSHDKYANVQTSFLLQKMEEYEGVVILASNFLQNFDEAFKRRIKFIIDFTLPDRERREQIWRAVLPPELPQSEEIDLDFMARSFELSGSSIKNIAVAAAFLAAQQNVPMDMAHLLAATQEEQHKAGKSIGQDQFGEYYRQLVSWREGRE